VQPLAKESKDISPFFLHPDRNFKTASSFSFACHLTFQPGLHHVRFIIVGGGNSFTVVALFSTVNNKK
jgi:hypothetical protein